MKQEEPIESATVEQAQPEQAQPEQAQPEQAQPETQAPPPVDPAPPVETTTQEQPTNNVAGKRFTFDFDLYHANNAAEFKQVTVHADTEEEAFDLADQQLLRLRTDENPLTWRYRGTFTKKVN